MQKAAGRRGWRVRVESSPRVSESSRRVVKQFRGEDARAVRVAGCARAFRVCVGLQDWCETAVTARRRRLMI